MYEKIDKAEITRYSTDIENVRSGHPSILHKSKRKLIVKIFKRLPKKLKAAVVFSVIFTLLFPFSLLAQSETQYKVPKNSLSYFLQNPSQSAYLETVTDEQTGAVMPPLTPITTTNLDTPAAANTQLAAAPQAAQTAPATQEPVKQGEFKDFVAPAPENIAVKAVDSNLFTEAPPVATAIETQTEVSVDKPAAAVKNQPAAAVTREPAVTATVANTQEYTANVNMTQLATSSDSAPAAPVMLAASTSDEAPVFSGVLAKMQQNKAKRVADAEKLGLVLPSQGGDIAAVSPSLSKIQQTLKTIMARQAA